MKNINSRPLFIFELANNHQGNLEHGLKIIREIHQQLHSGSFFDFNFAFKFQYRDIDNFIHPDFKERADIKYVKRFSETKMKEEELMVLKNEIDKLDFISICTPFDENSVDLVEKHNFDIIKIASCSFLDWPLLERISKTDKPIIASTAGVSFQDIDKVVSFLSHRDKKIILMHCVGQYPVPVENLQLNQIDLLQKRYPNIEIGYSTHEAPDNFDAIKMAIAKGVKVFEKHVGIKTEDISLNDYSATPEQIKKWLESAKDAFSSCGISDKRANFSEKELAGLGQFKRAVFAKRDILTGEKISLEEVFLAWPSENNQLLANDMSKYMEYFAEKDIKANSPIFLSDIKKSNKREKVYKIIAEIRKMLEDAKIALPNKVEVEVSHHYGIDKFYEWGAVLINCVNREYCKKLIVLSPGQKHPTHLHKQKEESFQVLSGDLILNLDGKEEEHKAGDIVLVKQGIKHSFRTKNGVIFEEVSTTHFKEDSFYEDPVVIENKNRKTKLTYWLNID